MPHVIPAALRTLRLSLVVALVGVGLPAAGQSPQPQPPPQLPSLTDTSFTVTIPRLDPGQTVRQTFVPSPSPVPGTMAISGEWPVATAGGGEAQVNRKIRAVLRSPFGQVVAEGCGYSKTAKPTSASTETKPALFAAGQFQAGFQDATSLWSITVSYCDSAGAPPSGASRVLGDIKIVVSYRASR